MTEGIKLKCLELAVSLIKDKPVEHTKAIDMAKNFEHYVCNSYSEDNLRTQQFDTTVAGPDMDKPKSKRKNI